MEPEQDRVRRILREQLQEARDRRKLAFVQFQYTVLSRGKVVDPEGLRRMRETGRAYSDALRNVTNAVRRQADYIVKGIIPDDLRDGR